MSSHSMRVPAARKEWAQLGKSNQLGTCEQRVTHLRQHARQAGQAGAAA